MVYGDADNIRTFFSLLRSGMYGIPVPECELPDGIDWDAVAGLARRHVVTGIIIESVRYLPGRLRPSGSVSARMERFALGLIQTNLVLDRTAAEISDFFSGHGIPGVLLKGQGVARYYREPQMRQSGDIDYYVGRKRYREAMELCRRHLIDEKDIDSAQEAGQHFGFDMRGVHIELHRIAAEMYTPFRNRRFQKWIAGELGRSPRRRSLAVGGSEITLPSLDFDALYIFYHAWCHYIRGGIGLRQLCDWAMIFHSRGDDIDTAGLVDNIGRFGLTKGWKLFGCIAVRHLGVPEQAMPLYEPGYGEKSEEVLAEILEGGNFGFYSKDYVSIPKRGNAFGAGLAKARAVTRYFRSLFPLIPVEATFLWLNRLFGGYVSFTRGLMRRAGGSRDKKRY